MQELYKAFTENNFEKVIEIYNSSCSIPTRKLLMVVANSYGKLYDLENELVTYKQILETDAKNIPEENLDYYSSIFNDVISTFINKATQDYIDLFNQAKSFYNYNNYIKAISFLDACEAICATVSVTSLKLKYEKEYTDILKEKTYSENKIAVYTICKNERAFVER